MDLHGHIIGMGHITDFLHLGGAAAGAHIRLGNLQGHILKIGCILPARIDPFAVGNGDIHILRNIPGRLRAGGIGLLEEEDIVGLCRLGELNRRHGIHIGVVLDDDIHSGAYRFPHGSQALHTHGQRFGIHFVQYPLLIKEAALFVNGKEIDLYGVIALGHAAFGNVRIVLGRYHHLVLWAKAALDLAGIGAQALPLLAAKELIQRHVEEFALDIPQGDVQRGDARKNHRASVLCPKGGFVQLVPDDLVFQSVHADDQLCQVLHHAHRRVIAHAIGQGGSHGTGWNSKSAARVGSASGITPPRWRS